MKRIRLTTHLSREDILKVIKDADFVNDRVKFEENKGKPILHVKEKGKRLKMKCEMIGGPTKDNGFLEGTYFLGTLGAKNGETVLSGVVVTAPIYHFVLALFMVFFVYRCISIGGFNPVPVILLIFSFMMFKGEFEKQGTIKRYLNRAFRRAEEKK